MKYGKLVDGALEKAPSYLKVGTSYVFNPSAQQYAGAGWLPVDDAWPAAPEGKVVASWTWVSDGKTISRQCEYKEAPEPEKLDVSTLSGLKSAAEKFAAALGFATCLALACRAVPVEKAALANLDIDTAEVVLNVDASAFLSTNYMDDVDAALAGKADASNSVQYVADKNGNPTAVTIGNRATNRLVGASSFALGTNTAASGTCSIAMGYRACATNDYSFVWNRGITIIPYYSHGNGTFNLNPTGGLGGLYIGATSLADTLAGLLPVSFTNQTNVALGSGAEAKEYSSGGHSVAIGNGAKAPKSSTAVGAGAKASGTYSTAVGRDADASYGSTALGDISKATGHNSSALGSNAQATNDYSVALGGGAWSFGVYSTALGYNAEAPGPYSTALGSGAAAEGNSSTALGYVAKASGSNSSALGYNAEASGFDSIALGASAKASSDHSIALGALAQATHTNSVVLNATGNYRDSQGDGTITLAVQNGLADVYVGTTSLADAVSNAVSGMVPVLDKVRVGGKLYNVSVSDGALALTPAEEGGGSE